MFIHLFVVLPLVEVLPMPAEARNRCKGETDWRKELEKLGKTDYRWKMKALTALNNYFKGIPKLKYCPEEEGKADRCALANIDNMSFVNPQCRPFPYRPRKVYEEDKIKEDEIANLLGQEYIKFCYEEVSKQYLCPLH
ncbi:unnamed protein product [Cylicocyclus nassatus]|uniref:Uncharacterized protein n=1 Tax=Cylicocyclus nassatus TaxID=53992 RepID=A0AA36DS42_CYLNA|nr:unnamed protein product [Cylicocyclus nassatus]